MYSKGNFVVLNQKWENQIQNDSDVAEFDKLYKETLPMILNFYSIENPDLVRLVRMLGSAKFSNPDMKECIDDMTLVEKWNAHMPLTVLSGRLLNRSSKALQPSEKRFLAEEDNVIQARIESLMNLFLTNNSEGVSQMIFNALETYKKILVCESPMQNKLSGPTLELLIKSLLIITCHRKDYDHLKSLIKLFPLHRKVQFIINETNAVTTKLHVKRCRLFICSAIAQDLLLTEISRPTEEQSLENLNLFVNTIVDLAINHDDVNRKLERIFLCANDMKITSDYYYLVANILRFKMPNKHEPLVVKLISIGISHDLSRIEQIKYTKDGDAMKFTEAEFIDAYRKIFAALLTLGFFVSDYAIRRLCIQAAAVCEPEAKICPEILAILPRFDAPIQAANREMKEALLHLREQLEMFQSAIKANVKLSTQWTKFSALCYENLDFLNRKAFLHEDLKPLEYPGVEKYLKRQVPSDELEEQGEKKEPMNATKVIAEVESLSKELSERIKSIKNPFRIPNDPFVIPPTPQEIKAVIIKAVRGSPNFELSQSDEVYMRLSEPSEKLKSYPIYFYAMNKEQKKKNKPNLYFDFDESAAKELSVTEMYQEGVIQVQSLCCQGMNIFDIENVMLFAILEKKSLYMSQEFVDFNKNQITKSSCQAAFFYLIARPLPQLALLCRTPNLGYTSTSILDYCVDHYTFDVTPCRYSYKKKGEEDDLLEERQIVEVKPKPARKPPAPRMLKPPPPKVIKQTPPTVLSPPGTPRPSHKAKRAPPVDLITGKDSFNASQELVNVFLLLGNELSNIIGQKVSMDLRTMCNPRSPHLVTFTYETSSEIAICVSSQRNHVVTPLLTKTLTLPARIHGSINVSFDFVDTIYYDEQNEPKIKTRKLPKISGCITFDHMSHQIKLMDIECTVCNVKSSFKISLRGGSRSWEKKTKEERKQRESSGPEDDEILKELKNDLKMDPGDASYADMPEMNFAPTNSYQRNGEVFQIKSEPDQNFQSPTSVIVRHQSPHRQTPVQVVNPMVTASGYFSTSPNLPSPTIAKVASHFAQQTVQTFSDGQTMLQMPIARVAQPRFSPHHFLQTPTSVETSMGQHRVLEGHHQVASTPVTLSQHPAPASCNQINYQTSTNLNQSPISPQDQINHQALSNHLLANQATLSQIPNNTVNPISITPHPLHQPSMNSLSEENQMNNHQESQQTVIHQQSGLQENPENPHSLNPANLQQPVNLEKQLNQHQNFTSPIQQFSSTQAPPQQYQNNPPESSVIIAPISESPKAEKCKIISVEGLPKMSFSGPLMPDMHVNGFLSAVEVKVEVRDFEEELSVAQVPINHLVVVKAELLEKADEAPVQEQTPPTSPPPLHYPKNPIKKEKLLINPMNIMKNKIPGVIKKEFSSGLIKQKLISKNTAVVIDLTDEAIDCDSPPAKRFHCEEHDPLAFSFVDMGDMPSSGIEAEESHLDREYSRVMKKVGMKMGPKRPRFDYEYERIQRSKVRECKVLVVDVMKEMANEVFQQHMKVKMRPVRLKLQSNYVSKNFNRRDVQLISAQEATFIDPDMIVEDPSRSTFQIVYQNSVSYQPLLTNANNQCNDKFSCKLNNANHVNNRIVNFASDKFLKEVDLGKSFDTNARRVNFTKNLKNVRKFARWSPKINNDAVVDEKLKSEEKKESSYDIPGLNSFEFFRLSPKRSLEVKVIHVIKNGSLGENDKDQGVEGQGGVTNGEASSSTHIQKIGQTSINETKTIQTFIKTYPPATLSSRAVVNDNVRKEPLKKVLNHDVNTSKVKIVACSLSQSDAQKTSRNQTLINMLTQQVMLPTNSNRHFIITNSVTKCENNVTTVSSSLPKKVATVTGQSQLVQILNSPPTNFTMKQSPNITVAPQNNATFKAELPSAAKQQGIVQFICKTDGKIIHLTPICSNSGSGGSKKITYKVDTTGAKGPTILHHANQQIIINNQLKKSDNQNILTIIQKHDDKNKPPSTPTSPISTRSIYEETYAKFIQTSTTTVKSTDMGLLTISSSPLSTPITSTTSSPIIQKIGKTLIQSSSQALPKFNQAFGKTIFTEVKGKKEIITSRVDTKPVTKITRTMAEIKSTDAGTLLSLLDGESSDKPLPTLQSNLLYARPIGNGKLLASNNSNVLLTALRGNNMQNNVRIITSMSETSTRGTTNAIMSPMRISVPIQIPKLINTSVRPQTPGNFRQQIVIATTNSRMQGSQNICQSSKLESLLMTSQIKQEIPEEPKQKKVDHSTLEQLREFDMVLEQVLERSSSEVTATSMSSPPTPDSPKKLILNEAKMKMNSVTITSISPCESPKPGSSSSTVKAAPKVQEDEHTAQRILDILANYKEQVRNSPDLNNKPAPRRRANPPTNPPAAKRKKIVVSSSGSMKSSKQFGSTSDMMTDTMGSEEDSSCGMGSGVASTGSMNNSPQPHDIDDQTDVSMDNNFYTEDLKRETALSPQSSSSSVATSPSPSHNKFPISRRLILTEAKPEQKNIVITNAPQQAMGSLGTTIERFTTQGSTAVLMPGNYLLPMNVLKSGQLAILSSKNGQKIIAVPTNQLQNSGTSIILQRYLNQSNDKTILSHTESAFKAIRPTVAYKTATSTASNTLYIRPIPSMEKTVISSQMMKQEDEVKESKFVSDKTLITEIIQQQQMSTHQHPQHNFMIKLNEHQPSDPRSSSSIMFVPNLPSTSQDPPKIKIEEIDYDDYMKEDAIDLMHDGEAMQKSPMLNTKIETDENTNSNHAEYEDTAVKLENDQTQKFQQFPIILNKTSGNQTSRNIKGFLIDPTNKIVMYNDRRPTTIEKEEFFNQKSFSDECADLGVDEPIASDLFPEADLLFDSGSPKFDQISSDNAMHIKKELENGEVLLEMNYNHNMETESWLNFDTEEELVDESPHRDDNKGDGGGHYF